MNLSEVKKIHFIGIGGISMSSLAEILLSQGKTVTGSDSVKSATTDKLEAMGIKVLLGQKAENITDDIDIVVYTVAVREDNPELVAAKNSGAAVLDRGELVGMLMLDYKYPVSVAGTHGKTTTSSLVTEIFLQADLNPTVSIGGMLPSINGNYKVGSNDYFILETCEYFDSFLKFNPHSAIILNVDKDHIDYFKNLDNIYKSFNKFAQRIPQNGFIVINKDIPRFNEVIDKVKAPVITYGKDNTSQWYPTDISFNELGFAKYTANYMNEKIAEIQLRIPGEHNVFNSLAAFALAYNYGLDKNSIIKGIYNYTGTDRRFQHKGSFNGITVVDDYAHHPTEISATINSARSMDINKLWIVFQPHTYSRTKALLDEFAAALSKADKVVLADIYASREKDTGIINSRDLADKIKAFGTDVTYCQGPLSEVEKYVRDNCPSGSLLITMGAGDVFKVGENLVINNK